MDSSSANPWSRHTSTYGYKSLDYRSQCNFVMRVFRKSSPDIEITMTVGFSFGCVRIGRMSNYRDFADIITRVYVPSRRATIRFFGQTLFLGGFYFLFSLVYCRLQASDTCMHSNLNVTRHVLNIIAILGERAELPTQTYTHEYGRVLSTKPYYSNEITAIKIKYTGFYRCRQ